jgi:hypothetical protein
MIRLTTVLMLLAAPASAQRLPVPPVPPVHRAALPIPPLPPGYHGVRSVHRSPPPARPSASAEPTLEAAPVPNLDAQVPQPRDSGGIDASPTLFRTPAQFRGDGYPYGATPQARDNPHAPLVPGVLLKLPIP